MYVLTQSIFFLLLFLVCYLLLSLSFVSWWVGWGCEQAEQAKGEPSPALRLDAGRDHLRRPLLSPVPRDVEGVPLHKGAGYGEAVRAHRHGGDL